MTEARWLLRRTRWSAATLTEDDEGADDDGDDEAVAHVGRVRLLLGRAVRPGVARETIAIEAALAVDALAVDAGRAEALVDVDADFFAVRNQHLAERTPEKYSVRVEIGHRAPPAPPLQTQNAWADPGETGGV